MHDLLFEHQAELDAASLQKYAAELRLNLHAFAEESHGEDVGAHLNADVESGVRSGVIGTPTFFVNGARLDGSPDYESLQTAIQLALDSAPA
jgi:protein-disulfide isomerase